MSEDLIRRSDAIKAMDANFTIKGKENMQTVLNYLELVRTRIDDAPTIEPKRGKWINKDPYWHTAICSNCNKVTMFEEWDEEVIEYDFCPNCGARMKGADDES